MRPTMSLPPGTSLGPYEILSAIDSGGMSSVYRARDPRLGRQVAIKVLPSASLLDDSLVKRFQREARAAAALQHPNIVAVHDVGETDVTSSTPYGTERIRVRYIVEELVEGPSLRRLIREGAIPLLRYVDIALGIARGLTAAHEKGLVHRDLKPENVLIDEAGRPKITDFGLVHWLQREGTMVPPPGAHDSLTRSGYVVGTLGYMSPEQARGDPLGPSSDLFVYGILLYELLTGISPFASRDPDEAFKAVLRAQPPPVTDRVPEAPPELVEVIERCLERNPSRRYASAAQVVNDLERLGAKLRGLPAPYSSSGARHRRREEAAAGVWLATALAVVLAFAGGYAVGHVREAAGPPPATAPEPDFREWRTELCAPLARDAEPVEAVLTPDAEQIVFTAARGDESDLFAVSTKGSEEPRRISGDDGGRAPYIGTDARVLFSSSRIEKPPSIWEVPLDGSAAPKLLVESGEEPALSPDESTLVFVRRREAVSELWLARRDGLFRRRLLVGQDTEWHYPAFTATGNAILVYDVRGPRAPFAGSAQLAFVPIANPSATTYPNARLLDAHARPVSFPDGRTFVRSFRERAPFVLEPAGRALRRLPFGPDLAVFSALRSGRVVLTRAEGGPLVLWRRS
jgi:hypothetical protein